MTQFLKLAFILAAFVPSVAFSGEITLLKKSAANDNEAGQDRSRYEQVIAYQDAVSDSIAASIMNRKSGSSVSNQNDPNGMQIKLMKKN